MPKVLNMHKLEDKRIDGESRVYIGRNPLSVDMHYGNPFSHMPISKASVIVDTREEAIEAFRKWITGEAYLNVEQERRMWILDHLEYLRGKDLVCWCSPRPCHGDVYLEMLYGSDS